jgi:hypothetical protein
MREVGMVMGLGYALLVTLEDDKAVLRLRMSGGERALAA